MKSLWATNYGLIRFDTRIRPYRQHSYCSRSDRLNAHRLKVCLGHRFKRQSKFWMFLKIGSLNSNLLNNNDTSLYSNVWLLCALIILLQYFIQLLTRETFRSLELNRKRQKRFHFDYQKTNELYQWFDFFFSWVNLPRDDWLG